jgi:hypothetical protein
MPVPDSPNPASARPLLVGQDAQTGEIVKLRLIGEGAFGAVYEGVLISRGRASVTSVAIKELKKDTPEENAKVLKEAVCGVDAPPHIMISPA